MNTRSAYLVVLGVAAVASVALFAYSRTSSGTNWIGGIVDKVASSIRGIRNNNPTNLEDSGIAWQGMTGTDGPYCKFATVHDGLRAASKNLKNYALLHGIDTVDGAIRRWSSISIRLPRPLRKRASVAA